MDIKAYMAELGSKARIASRHIARATTAQKNEALLNIADSIKRGRNTLLAANQQDLAIGKENGLEAALLDRLELTDSRVNNMLEGIRQVAALDDPVGEISDLKYRPSGIQVGRMRVPLGVIGIIYESRPNVTCEAASLCLKSGNATILRGGSEAINSNKAIADCINSGLGSAGMNEHTVQIVEITDRAAVGELIVNPEHVDVIIPRGGKSLIKRITSDAQVPVIKHLDGNCHLYIDGSANVEKSISVAINAKTQRYGTCCTLESLLVAEAIATEILPELCDRYASLGVELRGCTKTQKLVSAAKAASEEDWQTEYLAPILSIKIVPGLEEAINHINQHSSHHTESIMTEDHEHGQRFLREVDSSSVMINASTRFADGFEYGLGAEIGISTDKLHARGPVGLEGLTSKKFIVLGDGHIRT